MLTGVVGSLKMFVAVIAIIFAYQGIRIFLCNKEQFKNRFPRAYKNDTLVDLIFIVYIIGNKPYAVGQLTIKQRLHQ